MKRRAPTIWAIVVGLVVAGLVYRDSQVRKANERAAVQKKDAAFAAATVAKDEETPSDVDVPTLDTPSPSGAPPAGAARFHSMPDGSPVPALSDDAPKRVKLGVVLFRYQGAQGSSDDTRSRESALSLAQEAAKLAQTDFAAAVKKGDRGSSENIGWIGQRILERSVEHSVFSLETGKVSSAPIDTPRGFWVAKRLR